MNREPPTPLASQQRMAGVGALVAVGLAATVLLVGCWRWFPSTQLAAGGSSLTPSSVVVAEGAASDRDRSSAGLPRSQTAAETVATPSGTLAASRREVQATRDEVGTTILVVDADTERPIERFAIRIWSGGPESTHYRRRPLSEQTKDVPGGALVVSDGLKGCQYSIFSPGYCTQSARVLPVSEDDRRVLIRLEPAALIHGRLMCEGKPLAKARLTVIVTPPEALPSKDGAGVAPVKRVVVTDSDGKFEAGDRPSGAVRVTVLTSKLQEFDQVVGELERGGALAIGNLDLKQRRRPTWSGVAATEFDFGYTGSQD